MKSIRNQCINYIIYVNENGEYHREDGPALEYTNGNKEWYLNGKCHRTDGPALEYADGTKYYYLENKAYSYKEWDRIRKMLWLL